MPFDASPVESEVVTVLKKARALIDSPEKWCKRALERNGAYCALGAMNFAATGDVFGDNGGASRVLMNAVGEATEGWVASWNNAPERTHAEVMEAFDKAIILAGGTP